MQIPMLRLPQGPTQLSSKLGASSQETQASSQMKNNQNQFRFPMPQAEAIRVLAPYLWEYEKREIHEHEMIYFFNVNERIKN